MANQEKIDYAKVYTNPKVMEAYKKAIDGGVDIIAVFGAQTYELIQNDNPVAEVYEKLISKGMKIGFNPTVNPLEDKSVIDRQEIYNLDRASGILTKITGFFKPNQISADISKLYLNSVPLDNFDVPVDELTN
ncbi:MAG: hypothetical protein KAT28_05145 [Candidatus Aenigmarchaeota archaeon]|nr:hypothetical protein [Candidatus Aenigmarchaeota archaeon]